MRSAGRIGILLLSGALLFAPMPSGSAPLQEIAEPFDLGLREEAGVTLLFLDVKVRDKKGQPVRGLTLDDFEVTINGRLWPLAAVDDFCNCDGSPDLVPKLDAPGERAAKRSPSSGTAPEISVPAADAAVPSANALPQHFVIYFEFSQFQHTGRLEAERQARRWIEEGMQPGDRVMLAGYSTAAGLVEITPFTADRAILLEGLEAAFADKAFVDPFPLFLFDRLEDCPLCYKKCLRDMGVPKSCRMQCCLPYAKEEASQGRRALEALELFISSLESLPGRKQILYFNQNNVIFPQRHYLPPRGILAFSVTDQLNLMESVAATALASRTAINVASLPFWEGLTNDLGDRVVALGSNLADFSGGIASRTLYDLPTTLDRAGRECCMYRLSVQVPDDAPRRTLPAKVAVRGRILPYSYRVRFYTPQERWFRHARLALMTTSRSSDHQLRVSLLPLALSQGEWSVEIQVALSLQDLELVPHTAGRIGRWRVGALLHQEDGNKSWEMLTLAQATLKGTGGTALEALHRTKIEKMNPGAYRLRAFVEDAELNRFWSREVNLTLPARGKTADVEPWLTSPVVARRIAGRLDLELAPVTNKQPVSSFLGAPAPGFVPMNEDHVVAGTILAFRSMLCPAPHGDAEPQAVSILLQDGHPMARLPAAEVSKAGECVALTDTVDTSGLAPGDYIYRLMLNRGEKEDALMRDVAVTIFE